jgi:predicted transport protein
MPLFHIDDTNQTHRYTPHQFRLEKQLQQLIEANLDTIFHVRFITTEFSMHGAITGRIDTLGLDYNGAPTIVEYKRAESESVINQGLYYMNWLIEHRGDFTLAAQKALGTDVEEQIDWSNPRLIIVAATYAKWDTQAVMRMGEGIELWQYTLYGDDLLHLELVHGQQRTPRPLPPSADSTGEEAEQDIFTINDHLEGKPEHIQELFYAVQDGILSWQSEEGDIIETPNKLYISYRHGRNFAEVEVQNRALKIHIDIPHAQLHDPDDISRDVSDIGHWGTGDTQVKVSSMEEVDYVLSLIKQAYQLTL